MAINERLIDTEVAAAAAVDTDNLMLDLDASDVDSYDGDGDVWHDIHDFEYKPTTNVAQHFNTVTYTGDDGSSNGITQVGFQPDLVWIKPINNSLHHVWTDSVRGVSSIIGSSFSSGANTQDATWKAAFGQFDSFDTDGFTVSDGSGTGNFNSPIDYVAWCFKAGGAPSGSDKVSIDGTSYANEAAAGLTAGTIAVTELSVNRDLGFSIIKYTGVASGTVGHGLGVKPELIITKRTTANSDWQCYSEPTGKDNLLQLNTTGAVIPLSNYWGTSSPNSNVFGLSTNSGHDPTIGENIAYAFTSKRGVSKVGSYTGTGAAGNRIYTGFEPAFLMLKFASGTGSGDWIMLDNKRDTTNPNSARLDANSSGIEYTGEDLVDFNRDGFTLVTASDSKNGNGDTFIYYAVAKNTNETSLIANRDGFTAGSVETTNLELHLDANDYSGSGNWLDDTTNNNDGTITGATYVNDDSADYFQFDGSSDYVTVNSTSNNPIDASNDFSVEAWVNPTTLGATRQIVTKYGSSDALRAFTLGVLTDGKVNATLRSGSSSINTQTAAGVVTTSGGWYHLVLVRDGSSIKIYVNGSESISAVSSATINTGSTQPVRIGAQGGGSSNEFLGKIGQVRMYSSALTPTQVKSNYDATAIYALPNLELGLDAGTYSGSGNWLDSSGNSNDGTISGATWEQELGNSFEFVAPKGNSKITVPTSSDFNHSSGGTYEGWVYLNSVSTGNETFFSRVVNATGKGLHIYWLSAHGFIVRDFNTSGTEIIDENNIKTGATGFERGKWYHIAVSISSSSSALYALYVNGEFIDSATAASGTQQGINQDINIGYYGSGGSSDLKGNIGQFRMYSTVLSLAQIRQNYNFTKPNYPNYFHGTLGAGSSTKPAWNTNGYFDFDGDDYVDFNPIKVFSNYNFTMEVWVKTADTSGYISSFRNPMYITFALGAYAGGTNGIGIYDGSTSYSISNTAMQGVNDGDWHHVIMTHDGINLKGYIDGQLIGTTATGTTTMGAGSDNKIGTRADGNSGMTGSIGLYRLYTSVLTGVEAEARFNATKSHYGL